MEIHQYLTVPRHTQRMTTPSFAKKWRLQYNHWGKGTIIEEREVSWSWQHPSRTGQRGWRRYNHHSHNNLRQDLSDRKMANSVDLVLGHHTSPRKATCSSARTTKWSTSTATQAKSYWRIILNRLKPQAEKIIAEEQAGFRAGPQSRSLTYTFYVRNISSTSKTSTMAS